MKSFGEKVIADFLFEHDIAFKYERNHWWSGINYRPDFTIFKTQKSGVIIEYFGLNGDADYDRMSDAKRTYWDSKKDWELLEFTPTDIVGDGVGPFLDCLKSRLEHHGIPCIQLSEDEIWHRIRERAIDRFTKATVGFIGRCRKQSLSTIDWSNYLWSMSGIEQRFLNPESRLMARCGYSCQLNVCSKADVQDVTEQLWNISGMLKIIPGVLDWNRTSN